MFWEEKRKEIIYTYPVLIKGLISKDNCKFQIESLRERFNQGLQNIKWIYKVFYHLIIFIQECEQRQVKNFNNITIDTIYVLKNFEDPNIFIAIEDQNTTKKTLSGEKMLEIVLRQLGMNFQRDEKNQKLSLMDFLLQKIMKTIFGKTIMEDQKKLFQEMYNLKVKKTLYDQQKSAVYIIDTPYFIECDRNEIVVKYLEADDMYSDREIKLLEKVCKQQNCTQLFCYTRQKATQFLFMRKYDITLEALNNKIGREVPDKQDLLHLIIQLLLSLQDLHQQNIIHRDLKPENIMFEYQNDDQSLRKLKCVLIDFDRSTIARSQNIGDNVSEYQGTLAYQPPEGSQDHYQSCYDVWQIGYIILCVLLREKCSKYSRITQRPITSKKYEDAFTEFFKKGKNSCPEYFEIIEKMMNIDPNERPKLGDVLSYFQQFIQ